jgi:hypothetical protein
MENLSSATVITILPSTEQTRQLDSLVADSFYYYNNSNNNNHNNNDVTSINEEEEIEIDNEAVDDDENEEEEDDDDDVIIVVEEEEEEDEDEEIILEEGIINNIGNLNNINLNINESSIINQLDLNRYSNNNNKNKQVCLHTLIFIYIIQGIYFRHIKMK